LFKKAYTPVFQLLQRLGELVNDIVKKHNVTVNYLPMAPMKVFDETGGLPPPKRHPSRQRYRMDELKRWSSHLNLPMNLTPAHFPTDQTLAAQMVLAAGGASGKPEAGRLVDGLLTAVWAEELVESAKDEQWSTSYADTTAAAIEKGVFGSPTYQVGEEFYWGQDRLDFLDQALS